MCHSIITIDISKFQLDFASRVLDHLDRCGPRNFFTALASTSTYKKTIVNNANFFLCGYAPESRQRL